MVDFDLETYCNNLKATKPPYECPIPGCGRVYKSHTGIQAHLYNFDHDNPDCNTPTPKKLNGKKGGRGSTVKGPTPAAVASWNHRHNGRSPEPPEFFRSPVKETLSYAEAQRMVEIDLDGRLHRINIYEPLEIIPQDEIDNCDNTEKEELKPKGMEKANKETPKPKKEITTAVAPNTKLPEACFKVLEEYVKPAEAPHRPKSYYRFIEKTTEEMDEDVEYDMDEEVRTF